MSNRCIQFTEVKQFCERLEKLIISFCLLCILTVEIIDDEYIELLLGQESKF